MKSLFFSLWKYLGKIQRCIMIVTSVLVVILILVQVALRYLFKLPLMGVEELARMVGFWMYFVGAANGSRERSHIKADLLHTFIRNKSALFWAKSIGAFTVTILAGIMISWTWKYFQWSLKSWERSPALMIPMVYAQASLLVSAILMFFYFLVELVDYVRQACGEPPFDLPADEEAVACDSGDVSLSEAVSPKGKGA